MFAWRVYYSLPFRIFSLNLSCIPKRLVTFPRRPLVYSLFLLFSCLSVCCSFLCASFSCFLPCYIWLPVSLSPLLLPPSRCRSSAVVLFDVYPFLDFPFLLFSLSPPILLVVIARAPDERLYVSDCYFYAALLPPFALILPRICCYHLYVFSFILRGCFVDFI